MPTYVYRCPECARTQEVFARISDPPLQCPGHPALGPVTMQKTPTAPLSLHFTGSGCYATDYQRKR